MPTATAGDIINAALKEINVLAAGESPDADDSQDALAALNRLLDQWNAERLRLYVVTRTEFTITSGTATYNVASGETVNVGRPIKINSVAYQDTSATVTQEIPIRLHTEESWAREPQKDLESTYPSSAYYKPSFPTATLTFHPVPTGTTLEGVVYSWTNLSEFSGLTTSVSLPPGYQRMLVKHLALELAPSYGAEPNALLVEHARDAKEAVKTANVRLRDMVFPKEALIQGSTGGGYNIYAG